MRAIGLDLGEQRIGVAVSDDTGLITAPHGVVRRTSSATREILAIAADVGAQVIVIGLPLMMRGGREGTQAAAARIFGDALAAQTMLPVEFYDERLTTVMAERTLQAQGRRSSKKRDERERRRESVDALAAAIILQSWLDRRRLTAPPPDA
ncbi:MAG: Holliday junction resolvase RuvX [Chloroflexi bacterium]|nr:Holliday junction resolvase RuvX [Chloroflexota bacterium]